MECASPRLRAKLHFSEMTLSDKVVRKQVCHRCRCDEVFRVVKQNIVKLNTKLFEPLWVLREKSSQAGVFHVPLVRFQGTPLVRATKLRHRECEAEMEWVLRS